MRVAANRVDVMRRTIEQFKHFERSTDDGWSNRIREQIWSRTLTQNVNHLSPSSRVAASATAQCLSKRRVDDLVEEQ